MRPVNPTCPNCGAPLTMDGARGTAHCEYCDSSFLMDDDFARAAREDAGPHDGANTSDHGVFQDTIRQWISRSQTAITPQALTSLLVIALLIIAFVLLANPGLVLSLAIVAATVVIVVALIKKKDSDPSEAASTQWSQGHASTSTAESSKSRLIALLLCAFGGYCGAHYFYVGRPGMGILYLFTAGLFGFGWFVDIFRVLGGTFTDSNGQRVTAW